MRGAGNGAGGIHLARVQIGNLVFQHVGAFASERFRIHRDAVRGDLRILLLRRLVGVLVALCGAHLRLRFALRPAVCAGAATVSGSEGSDMFRAVRLRQPASTSVPAIEYRGRGARCTSGLRRGRGLRWGSERRPETPPAARVDAVRTSVFIRLVLKCQVIIKPWSPQRRKSAKNAEAGNVFFRSRV